MHTEGTLALMNDAFQKFNKLKDVFVKVSPSSLKFPKMHMLTHFKHFIHHYGTLDNMDTEYTEHTHIPFAKVPYRHSNKCDLLLQIVQCVVCQEALEQKLAILGMKSNLKAKQSQAQDFTQYTLSSMIREGPLPLKSLEDMYKLQGLEVALRTYFHDVSCEEFGPGKGKRHRVYKRKLPQLDECTVSYFICLIVIYSYGLLTMMAFL